MDIGTLDAKITIQKFTSTKDDWGQPIEAWVDLATVWGSIRFQSGKEFISADRETAQTQASIRIRKRAVDTTMRVLHEGRTYEVTAVLPHHRKGYIDIAVKEII